MVLSSRQLNALHTASVRTLIGAGFVATGLTIMAVYNLTVSPPQGSLETVEKDKEMLEANK